MTTGRWLQVDLGATRDVTGFVVKNAGPAGEWTDMNTVAYTIATSFDGVTFTPVVDVSGLRNSRTYHPIAATPARYVRLVVNVSGTSSADAARIPEFEVYG